MSRGGYADRRLFIWRGSRNSFSRAGRHHHLLEVEVLVLVDDQPGIETVQAQLAEIEHLLRQRQIAATESLPGQQRLVGTWLNETQVAHGKFAPDIDCVRSLGVIECAALGGELAVGQRQRRLCGKIGLGKFQGEVGQLEIDFRRGRGRHDLAFGREMSAATGIEGQAQRQRCAHVAAEALDLRRNVVERQLGSGRNARIAQRHAQIGDLDLVDLEAPGCHGFHCFSNGFFGSGLASGKHHESLLQVDAAIGFAYRLNTAVRQFETACGGIALGQRDANIPDRQGSELWRVVDLRQGKLPAIDGNRADDKFLLRQLEAAILQLDVVDGGDGSAGILQGDPQAGQLRLDLFDRRIDLSASVADPIAGRHSRHAFGRNGQRSFQIGGELRQLQIGETEGTNNHHWVEIDLADQIDPRTQQGSRGDLEFACVVGQRGQIGQLQVERCDTRDEAAVGTPIGEVELAIDQLETADVETRQALLLLRLFFAAFQRGEEGRPVERATGQFHDCRCRSIQPDRVEYQRALCDAGRRNINQQRIEAQQRLTVGLGQLQLAEAQGEPEGIEFGPVEHQAVTGLFGDEFFRLRLNDARQGEPQEQQGGKAQANQDEHQFLEQAWFYERGEFHVRAPLTREHCEIISP